MSSLLKQLSGELEALIAKTAPSVVGIEHGRGQGTGWVLAPDGYVLTNAHVVQARSKVRVRLSPESDVGGEVVGTDPKTDLAVVRLSASGLVPLPLADPQSVKVGQWVVAIGNPFRFDRSVSFGVVSALDRTLPTPGGGLIEGLVQTDAAINPGNSGGPLVNPDGEVVGINTAVVPYAQGIGFAVPARTASWVASVLISKGEVRRPYLGIAARSEELDRPVAQEAGQPRAIRIFKVEVGTAASAAGLRNGDLVLCANGDQVSNIDDLQRVMVLGVKDTVRLEVLRDGKRKELHARVTHRAQVIAA